MNKRLFNVQLLVSSETRQELLTSLTLAIITIADLFFVGIVAIYSLLAGDASGLLYFGTLGVIAGTAWYLSRTGRWRWVTRVPTFLFFLLGIYGSFTGFSTTYVSFYIIAFILSGLLINKYEMLFVALAGLIVHAAIAILTSGYQESLPARMIVLAAAFTGVVLLQWVYIVIADDVFKHSLTDSLSQAFNRSYFDATMQILQKSRQHPLGILIADIDGMKKVNDSLGHAYGDLLIVRAAYCLRAACRAGDILCRIGGDEFAVIFTSTDEEALRQIARRVSRQVESDNREYPELPLRLSIGTATTGHPDQLPETFRLADARMYADKMKNKNESSSL